MLTILLIPMMAAQAPSPLVESERFPTEKQWAAIEACPRVIEYGPDGGYGSAVVVGIREGYAYALTASHVVKADDTRIELIFFHRDKSSSHFTLKGVVVAERTKSPDLALLKVKLNDGDPVPPVLKLAAPGDRPKRFSFSVLTVGCNDIRSSWCEENLVVARRFVRRADKSPSFFWETQNTSVHGRSGGPMLDGNLRIIGVCSANGEGRGYFAHADEIHAWLKQLGYSWLWKAS